jgi:signal transduction histidine kinase
MTSDAPPQPDSPVSDAEMAGARQMIQLLIGQINSRNLDTDYVTRQLGKLDALLARLDISRGASRKAGRFEALYNVSRALGASLDLQVVLDQVMDAIIQLTGAERGFLMLADYDGQLSVKAARNFDQQTLTSEAFLYSTTVANRVLDTGAPVLTTNASEDPRFAGRASIVTQSLRSIMATPLRARGNVIGVAYVDSRFSSGLFTQGDLEALEALSAQAAVAIDNAMLFNATDQELAQRLEELRQLRRIDLQLSETLDADTAMQHTLEWACKLGGASSGYLGLLDGDALTVRLSYGAQMLNAGDRLDARYPQVAAVIAAREADTVALDGRHVMIVPVMRQHMPIGAVILESGDERGFTLEQQDLVERVVARAAISIENGRLYAAVRAADRAKSEFVGIVAHDLKAPMTGMRGYADLLLLKGDMTERQTEYVERIKDAVHRMEMLVSDLADISRIESGHFFFEESRVRVDGVLQALRDSVMPQINERGHTYEERIDTPLPELWADYYRLLQVLVNLVSNAYKYTPNGGRITLEAQRDGQRVRFAVSDTGVGMDAESLSKLGTKFWRAPDEFTRSQPGSGLGFAITRSLIEQMGSQIEIESAPGAGSRFAFSVAVYSGV